MTDLSVIILVGREELHIRRCLEKLAPLEPRQVFVIESQQGDRTHEIATETASRLGWQVAATPVDAMSSSRPQQKNQSSAVHLLYRPAFYPKWHDWPGNQASQFNWALGFVEDVGERYRCRADGSLSSWILRLDADEYLTPETIENLKVFLSRDANSTDSSFAVRREATGRRQTESVEIPRVVEDDLRSKTIAGLTLELKRRFCGGEIRHATNGIRILRLWRSGRGQSEERAMDEHIAIDGISNLDELREKGLVIDFPGAFYDDNLNSMDWWREKHRGYAKREAADALAFARGELHFKPMKERYYRLPPYFRAFAYFCIRYFLKGGFLDGRAGWMWNFWQGLWYRWIVDKEISRLKM